MRKIIYSRPDGGVSVVYPVRNTIGETLTTDEEIEQRAWDKLPKDAINPRWADASEIPTDRTFRNAWEDNAGIKVNMLKAREIHKNRLRAMRKPKFEVLDVEYMTADEVGNSSLKAQIVEKKKALRDVTIDPRIESAQTPEELKAAIPNILL